MKLISLLACGIFALAALCASAAPVTAQTTIPFVGCAGSGPTPDDGSWAAPTGRALATKLPPAIAGRLALYASNWSAVLAPRGWVCRSIVTPLQGAAMIIAPPAAMRGAPKTLGGPSILVWNDQSAGPVAAFGGRYFPARRLPPGVPAPRLAADSIQYQGKRVLAYKTPAHRHGLASQTSLPGTALPELPSYGLLALSGLPRGAGGIVNLTIRLPPAMNDLRPRITAAFAACLPDHNDVACEAGGALVAQGEPMDDGD